jgi:hypothetical protein
MIVAYHPLIDITAYCFRQSHFKDVDETRRNGPGSSGHADHVNIDTNYGVSQSPFYKTEQLVFTSHTSLQHLSHSP